MGQLDIGRALKGLITAPSEAATEEQEAAGARLKRGPEALAARRVKDAGTAAAADAKREPYIDAPGSLAPDSRAPNSRAVITRTLAGESERPKKRPESCPVDGEADKNVGPNDGAAVEAELPTEITAGGEAESAAPCGPGAAPAGSLTSIKIRRRRSKSPVTSLDGKTASAPPPKLEALEGGAAKTERNKTAVDAELPQSMLAYWESLKGERRYPSCGDLDPKKIAELWPSSLVLNLGVGSRQAQVERSFSMKLRAARDSENGLQERGVEYTPMMVEWILSLGRLVSEVNGPVEDTEAFPTRQGDVRYHILALPLSDDEGKVDRALCHIAHN